MVKVNSKVVLVSSLILLGLIAFGYRQSVFFDQKNQNDLLVETVAATDVDSLDGNLSNSSERVFSASSIRRENELFNEEQGLLFFSESDIISEQLQQLSDTFNWSEVERLRNASLWQEACDSVKGFTNNDSDLQALAQADMSFIESKKLSDLCSDFSLDNEIDILDFALSNINDETIGGVIEATSKRDSVLENDGEKAAVNLIITQISNALDRLDESSLHEPLWYLADKQLIAPPLFDQEVNSYVLYFNVIQEVSSTLICQKVGGCRGSAHPMVLRQCLMAQSSRGSICYKPNDIYDAIYQTLSPLQLQAFDSMLGQINQLLKES